MYYVSLIGKTGNEQGHEFTGVDQAVNYADDSVSIGPFVSASVYDPNDNEVYYVAK